MRPLVTVITPTYNCGKYLDETIKSVLNQTYDNLEYIVIDDCSTDDTARILKQYEDVLISVRHTVNQGEQKTINEALKMVKERSDCKYFVIVNADDLIYPGAISTLFHYMESCPGVLCAYPDWDSINEDGSFKYHVKSMEYDFDYMVRHHTCLPSVGSMFRSSVIESVGYRDTSYRWLGDFDYWLRIGCTGRMIRVPYTLAAWRNRNGQASASKNQIRASEHVRIMSIEKGFYSRTQITPEIWDLRFEAWCWSYLVAASVTGVRTEMLGYVWKAICIYPKLLGSLEFWDAMFKRAKYILRR
jgi:glycosyltransferase involved in cell wall biosynthesis